MDTRNDRKPPVDEYARVSFRWRRMTRGQIAGMVIAAVVIAFALAFWDSAGAANYADLPGGLNPSISKGNRT